MAFSLQLSSYFTTTINFESYASALAAGNEMEAINSRNALQIITDFFGLTGYQDAIKQLFAIVKSPDSACFQKNIHQLAALVIPEERASFNEEFRLEVQQRDGNSFVQIYLDDFFIAQIEFEGHLKLSDKYFQPIQEYDNCGLANTSYFQINPKFQQLIIDNSKSQQLIDNPKFQQAILIANDANTFYKKYSDEDVSLANILAKGKTPFVEHNIDSIFYDLPRTLKYLPLNSKDDNVITQGKFKRYIFKHVRRPGKDTQQNSLVNKELEFTCTREEWPEIFKSLPIPTQLFLIVVVSQGLKSVASFANSLLSISESYERILIEVESIYHYRYVEKLTEGRDHECTFEVTVESAFTDDIKCKANNLAMAPIKALSRTNFEYSFLTPKGKKLTSTKVGLDNIKFEVYTLHDEEEIMRSHSCKKIRSNTELAEQESSLLDKLSASPFFDYPLDCSYPLDILGSDVTHLHLR